MGDHGNMDFDWRKRCVMNVVGFDVIYYGLSARDHAELFAPCMNVAKSLPSPYAELSRDGRRPGQPIEMERTKHFFTKSLRKEEGLVGGGGGGAPAMVLTGNGFGARLQHVQGSGDANSVGAHDAEGRAGGAQETKTGA